MHGWFSINNNGSSQQYKLEKKSQLLLKYLASPLILCIHK